MRRSASTSASTNPLPAQNRLLEQLGISDRRRFLLLCEPVELVLGDSVCEKGSRTRYVYFPTVGFISLIAVVEGTPGVEVGLVGREGMVGAQLALGVDRNPLFAVVQGAGRTLRIGAAEFRAECKRSVSLRIVLSRYIAVLMEQLSTSVACARFHQIEPRLARWILMSNDRAHSDTFHLTQEFLAHMLGVRRVGVTAAAGGLQRLGFITYRRGLLTVLDRRGLEDAACLCYATNERVYRALLP